MPNGNNIIWTDQITKTFIEMVNAAPNLTYKEIAELMSDIFKLPFTKNSLIGKARRLKLEGVEKTADEPTTIYDLEWGMCKWPLGGPDSTPPYFYCGLPTGDLSCSWCSMHRKIVWTKSHHSTYVAS